ncbi:hypothetical protein D9757_010760 [Collybiopsis confluens]|uniref:Beta-hexosaminidase bacterial type N-terminal domain-containing protein n=1 Tax=Collybiopsis confluens TaxID=2823264 RepID=A0A8H5H8P4_9AGAR|nr:hypothetical protein D9757_010760 [Collybiopsis confluens]
MCCILLTPPFFLLQSSTVALSVGTENVANKALEFNFTVIASKGLCQILHPIQPTSSFIVDSSVTIVVDTEFAENGSPSLAGFAHTFHSDLESVTGFGNLSQVRIGKAPSNPRVPTILLTLGASQSANLTLFSGKSGNEGYKFEVTDRLYTIRGASAKGTWWGTRTLLQQVILSIADGSNPAVIATGSGRHWFEPSFLADLYIYAFFFKIQEFHLHASGYIYNLDILSGPNWRELYSGFRFQPPSDSPIFGLVPELNKSWTQDQFTTPHVLSYQFITRIDKVYIVILDESTF